ncbi:ethylene-responsive transcription factor ERF017-like [Pistacia vera]|uniref:ethylene-responsive transcription factor ERF017-like n=1 Tax=Pistacia vera TaxID=55513 RepID=UPI001262EEB8|nr:ethylene-responsive transcription factor ERF017-like [Pistacia vera]XP_031287032.1 ethylene-responsive transcription factor ERF017-like [Pistacia vera]
MVKTATNSITEPSSSSNHHEPKYKGVRKRKWGKWVSEIRLPNSRERIWLGSYESPEKAARAFDAALFCLRGPSAKLNFPNNPPEINITGPGGRALQPQEIQVIAARYANEEQEPQRNSLDYNNVSSSAATSHYTSSSSYGVAMPVDVDSSNHTTMDWSFLSMLDSNERAVASDFGLYSGLDISMNMNMNGDEQYPPPPETPTAMINENEEDHENVYSQSSFLWNF